MYAGANAYNQFLFANGIAEPEDESLINEIEDENKGFFKNILEESMNKRKYTIIRYKELLPSIKIILGDK